MHGRGVAFRGLGYDEFDAGIAIDLCDSFETAFDHVRTGKVDFGIVPAAYNNLFRLHCQYRDLAIADAFPLATKEMVLAKRADAPAIRTVALHPTTKSLAPAGAQLIEIPSKPLCVEAVLTGTADAAIGSRDVAEAAGLEIVESFGEIPMSWEVFARRR